MPFAQPLNPQILPDDNDDHFCAARFFTQRYIDIADAIRGRAIRTDTRFHAGGLSVQPSCILRTYPPAYSLLCRFDIGNDLIDS